MDLEQAVRAVLLEELSPAGVDEMPPEPDVVEAAYRRLAKKPWRRTAVDPESRDDALAKLRSAFEDGRPVELSIPFGGYKGWRVPSSPLPDWAEVFSLAYIRRWLAPVAGAWPHGVRVDLTYISGVMDLVSNMPLARQDAYVAALRAALDAYSCPEISFRTVDLTAQFAPRTARDALLERFSEVAHQWSRHLPPVEQDKKLASARRNLVWLEGVEPTPEEIRRSAMMCDALDSLPERRSFNKYGRHIQVVFVRGPKPSIHIGSCATSSNHFWVSSGVLEAHGDRLLPRLVAHDGTAAQTASFDVGDVVSMTSLGAWPALASIAVVGRE